MIKCISAKSVAPPDCDIPHCIISLCGTYITPIRLPVSVGNIFVDDSSVFGFKTVYGTKPRGVLTVLPSVINFLSRNLTP